MPHQYPAWLKVNKAYVDGDNYFIADGDILVEDDLVRMMELLLKSENEVGKEKI